MKNFLFFLSLFTTIIGFSQNENDYTIYLDSLKKISTQGNHFYYREVKNYHTRLTEYQIKQYYKSGKLESEGISTDRDFLKGDGEIISYFENGNKKTIFNYNKGVLNGIYSIWYENGNIKEQGTYLTNIENTNKIGLKKIYNYWDENNIQTIINGNGVYTEHDDAMCTLTGAIVDGLKSGEWKGFNKELKFTFTETYKNGKLITGKSTNQNNEVFEYQEIFTNPEPSKGLNHFYKHIANNFQRPSAYEDISGRIILTFVINKNGEINNVKVIKGIGFGYDEEAIRVIRLYNDWNIGKIRGVKTNTSYAIPIFLP